MRSPNMVSAAREIRLRGTRWRSRAASASRHCAEFVNSTSTFLQRRETAVVKLGRRIGILVACGLVANVIAGPLRALGDLRDTDFIGSLVAGRMMAAGTHCVYCLADQRAAASAVIGVALPANWDNYFVTPPPTAFVMRALTLLPPRAALGLFAAGGLVCMVAAVVVIWRRALRCVDSNTGALVAIASVFSLPAASGLALGQWDPYLVLPATLATLLLVTRQSALLAGALLSLLLVKPQVALLAVPVLCVLSAWRVLRGFVFGASIWVAVSLVTFGGQVLQWPAAASAVGAADASLSVSVPGALALVTGSWATTVAASLLLSAVVIALAVVFRGRLRSDPAAAVSLAIAVSLLVAPHLFWDDYILLAPLFMVWGRRSPLQSFVGALALSAAFAIDALTRLPGFHLETAVVACIVVAAAVALLRPDQRNRPVEVPRVVAVTSV